MRTALALCLAAAAASACATEFGGEDDGAFDDGGKADSLAPGEIPTLAPAYALRLDAQFDRCKTDKDDDDGDGVRDECDGSGLTSDHHIVTALWQPTQADATARGPLTVCTARSAALDQELELDPDFLQSLPPLDFTGHLVAIGGEPALSSAQLAVVLGARLADPLNEAMPTSPSDPRVIDHDQDGRPGVSVSLPIGSIFVGLRVVLRLEGALDGAAFAGRAEFATSQAIYGDSIPFVDAIEKVNAAAGRVLTVGEHHGFVLVPVATASCAAAAAALP